MQIGTPGPTDGANVKAYLSGLLGLGKRASNVNIIWFNFGSFRGGSFGSVFFGSSPESKNVVQRRLLWSLTNTDATDSGPEPSFDRPLSPKLSGPEVCTGGLLQRSALEVCSRCLLWRSSTKELSMPFKDPKREFRSSRKIFETLSLDESRSPEYNLFSYLEENFEEEAAEKIAETMEQYISKTQADYGYGVALLFQL
nr:hypothetical protein [Tanacetum cinerariifolium]